MKVNYRGDLLAPSGYSRAIRAHMRALIEAGVEVHGDYNQHDQTRLDLEKHPFWSGRMRDIVKSREFCPVKIWHETPEFFEPDPMQYNIAYTVWETSKIIDFDLGGNPRFNWVKQMNRMDEVWTSAEFCKQVFIESGVTVPIRVFPHPIDVKRYQPEGDKFPFIAGNKALDDCMVFLSVFQFTKRKNPQDLLIAWTSEFADQEDVALVIKTYGSDFKDNSQIRDFVHGLRKSCRVKNMVGNVHLILDLIPDEDMPELYRMCDTFVLPSYGEGFGMPYQEAMACGRPVIYTRATAMPEFCVGWPVDCDAEPVYDMLNIPWYNAQQNWWKTRVSDLKLQMRRAYNTWKGRNREDTLKLLSEEARQQVVRLHSFEAVGQAMRARLEEIQERAGTRRIRRRLAPREE